MNIATLGLKIDPSGVSSGGRVAKRDLEAVRQAMEAVEKAANAANKTLQKITDKGAIGKVSSMAAAAARMVSSAFSMMVKSVSSAVTGIVKALGAIGLAIDGLNKLMAPLKMGFAAAFDFGTSAIDQAGKIESITAALRGLLQGSLPAAKKLMGEFQQLGLETPFEFEELAQAGRSLLAFKGNAKDVVEELRRIGDVASLVQAPIGEIADLYGKMRVDNRIMTMDLNQLGGRGIPILGELAKVLKVTDDQVRSMAEDGKIKFKHLEEAIVNMTSKGGPAYQQMILQSETWFGKLSNLSDAWNKLKTAIGEPIIAGLKPMLDLMSTEIAKLEGEARKLGPALKEAAMAVTAAFKVATTDGGLMLSLKAAADLMMNTARRGWEALGIYVGQVWARISYDFTAAMKLVASRDFWRGVGEALVDGVKAALLALKGDTMDNIYRMIGGTPDSDTATADAQRKMQYLNEDVAAARRRQSEPDRYASYAQAGEQAQADANLIATAADRMRALSGQLPEIRGSSTSVNTLMGEPPPVGSFTDIFENQTSDAPSAERGDWMSKFGDAWNWLVKKGSESSADGGPQSELFPDGNMLSGGEGPSGGITDYTKGVTAATAETKALTEETKAWEAGVKKSETAMRRAQKAVQDAKSEHTKMLESFLDVAKQMDMAMVGIGQSITGNLAGALTDVITGAKSAKEAFSMMASSIVKDIVQITMKLIVQYFYSKLLGLIPGGGAFMAAASSVGAAVHHNGGSVGDGTAPTRAMSASVFAGARRMHSGGTVGPNEEPAILERGEEVLTKTRADAIRSRLSGSGGSGSGLQVTIINLSDPNAAQAELAKNPQAILNLMAPQLPKIRAMVAGKGSR